MVVAAGTALLYLIQLIHVLTGPLLIRTLGIFPRQPQSLPDILSAPLLHAGWLHLMANTVPFVVFAFLTFLAGLRPFLVALAMSWLVSGLTVWLIGGGITVGISGVIFGLFAFLLVRGFLNRAWPQILLALVLLACYGGILWGLLPTVASSISWQGHLGGAVGGVLAAVVVRRRASA
ncbi:rhomboid family intramembrane serine protease [Paenarthrobacter sp. Z7-10]|uniref:rhomboid family intramembrane serine protease n=1 Tax=Paenarthrobacter sp. Z7-10 TaxID=2787635 RepID=UPI0022A913F6|nr:rhomboid family intramembrane serine protease [Paenarthrobacter sp. Z7-10]